MPTSSRKRRTIPLKIPDMNGFRPSPAVRPVITPITRLPTSSSTVPLKRDSWRIALRPGRFVQPSPRGAKILTNMIPMITAGDSISDMTATMWPPKPICARLRNSVPTTNVTMLIEP